MRYNVIKKVGGEITLLEADALSSDLQPSKNNATATSEDATDDIAPIINVPSDSVEVEATSQDGTEVTYRVTAEDDIDGTLEPDCTPPSGSLFPVGETVVKCTATDSAGNRAVEQFTVIVTLQAQVDSPPLTFDRVGGPC
jgi:hypothetical protein